MANRADGESVQDATRLTVFGMAEQVQAGTLPRVQFDLACQQMMQLSQLRHADYLAAIEVAEGR